MTQSLTLNDHACISLIGMPGVGKTSTGSQLAQLFSFVHLDTDYIIESIYGVELQTIADNLTKNEFLDLESEVLEKLYVKKALLSTGGSVVYRDLGMHKLKSLGPCIFLKANLDLILERIALNPDRGLAIAPGQTIEDLYNERMELYSRYADYTIEVTRDKNVQEVAEEIYSLFQ